MPLYLRCYFGPTRAGDPGIRWHKDDNFFVDKPTMEVDIFDKLITIEFVFFFI